MRLSSVLWTVGIGAFLAAVLLPVFAQPTRNGPRSICLSDLKQAGLAQIMYSGDFDDRFPGRDEWIDASYPYAKNWQIFHCPQSVGQWGYAFNGALDRKKTPPNSLEIPLLYDSVNPAKNASDLFKSLPTVSRHGGGNNVVYADGHTKRVKHQERGGE